MNVERLLNYIGQSKKDPTNRLTKKGDMVKLIKNKILDILHILTKSIRRKKFSIANL
jgi:hypothetical protein